MKKILTFILLLFISSFASAQQSDAAIKPITLEDYTKAKEFKVKDLDNDTYVKVGNTYVLDRYEMRKPYFITGDDGLKKRIDLYKLVLKDGMHQLGTVIYYTNEKGKMYTAVQPNFTADPKVWEKYFEDIHAIDKEEKNFVLKLSYILSKEMSFQLYKALNAGKDLKGEAGTYGTDICFPGDLDVALQGGQKKKLAEIKPGDMIVTVDPVSGLSSPAEVVKLEEHEAKNYAITSMLFVNAVEVRQPKGIDINLSARLIQATPNHPIQTLQGRKTSSELSIGEQVLCFDESSNAYKTFTLINKEERAAGLQKVYNMVVREGSTFVLNNVMVLQK